MLKRPGVDSSPPAASSNPHRSHTASHYTHNSSGDPIRPGAVLFSITRCVLNVIILTNYYEQRRRLKFQLGIKVHGCVATFAETRVAFFLCLVFFFFPSISRRLPPVLPSGPSGNKCIRTHAFISMKMHHIDASPWHIIQHEKRLWGM